MLSCVATTQAQDDKRGDVVIHSDARLAVLLKKSYSYARLTTLETAKPIEAAPIQPIGSYLGPTGLVHREPKTIYNGKGFRVQIYNGPDREKAILAKKEFMRRFPGVSTYLIYMAPSFRVKIGDYRSRSEAEGMLREANSIYSPSMIVPDMVTVSVY